MLWRCVEKSIQIHEIFVPQKYTSLCCLRIYFLSVFSYIVDQGFLTFITHGTLFHSFLVDLFIESMLSSMKGPAYPCGDIIIDFLKCNVNNNT